MINFLYTQRGNGGTGRRSRLRTCRAQALGGSNPSSRTINAIQHSSAYDSCQGASCRFRKKQRQKRSRQKCSGQQPESWADAVTQRQSADSKRCHGRKSAAYVVAKPHGRRANFAWEYFAGNGGI